MPCDHRTNYSDRAARGLRRSEFRGDDAFLLGSLIILQWKGQIIIPDFGFYYASLIRQNRLIAGLYTLSELDEKLRQLCLLMPKVPRQCTYEDAQVLAKYARTAPELAEAGKSL